MVMVSMKLLQRELEVHYGMATIPITLGLYRPFSIRGVSFGSGLGAGLFSFSRHAGESSYNGGFRVVLVVT